MILTLAPRILTALRVGRQGPAFVDIRPCRGGARLTASNGHTVSVVASGSDVEPLRLHWADVVRIAKMAGKEPALISATQCRAGGFSFPITTLVPDAEVPRPPMVRLRLSDAVVTDVLRRVMPAMSTDDSRPHLYGVNVERRGGVLTFATTDGHRLHQKTIQSEGRDFTVLLSAPAVVSLARLKGDLTLRMEEYPTNPDVRKRVVLRRGRDWVACEGVGNVGLIGGGKDAFKAMPSCTFPDVAAVIPSVWESEVVVDAVALRRALAIVDKHGLDQHRRDGHGTARLEWVDGLRISTAVMRGDDLVRMVGDVLPAKGGMTVLVSMQARYLLGALGRTGEATIRLSGEIDPVRIESDGMIVVAMPLRD